MSLKSGHCAACLAPLWRSTTHPTTGESVLLWPAPTGYYAQIETSDGRAPGIPYCPRCVPAEGAPGPPVNIAGPTRVFKIERAGERYAYWYSDKYGDWLRRWLIDELELPEHQQAELLAQWEADREAVMVGL